MRSFWNERAREDAYYFVDNRLEYGDPDLEQFWRDGELDLNRLLSALGAEVGRAEIVVDIGCGVGRLTRPLAARAAYVYGIDISSEMIARARRHHLDLGNVEWIAGDGATLAPLGDASVDGCVSHVVFQHIPDPEITFGYIREMGRVLRPGGWAAFQVSNAPAVHERRVGFRARMDRVRAATGRHPRGQDDPAWRGSSVDLADLREAARSSGLELARIVGEGTLLCLVLARKACAVDGPRRPDPARKGPGLH
jgi:SAM-dependent methyltransferase